MSEAVVNSILAGFVGVYVVFLIAIIIFLICLLIGRIALFKKCGEAGWKAIIPFYSDYVMDVKILHCCRIFSRSIFFQHHSL